MKRLGRPFEVGDGVAKTLAHGRRIQFTAGKAGHHIRGQGPHTQSVLYIDYIDRAPHMRAGLSRQSEPLYRLV